MGIFDKLFGSSSNDDKYVIFLCLADMLARVDGDASNNEGNWILSWLKSKESISEERFNRLVTKSEKIGPKVFEEAKNKLNDDEKHELINFLTTLAQSDNDFDAREANFIVVLGILIGLDWESLYDHLITNFDIDQNEMNRLMTEAGKLIKDASN